MFTSVRVPQLNLWPVKVRSSSSIQEAALDLFFHSVFVLRSTTWLCISKNFRIVPHRDSNFPVVYFSRRQECLHSISSQLRYAPLHRGKKLLLILFFHFTFINMHSITCLQNSSSSIDTATRSWFSLLRYYQIQSLAAVCAYSRRRSPSEKSSSLGVEMNLDGAH